MPLRRTFSDDRARLSLGPLPKILSIPDDDDAARSDLSPRPQLVPPILLSSGRPLKSSLKPSPGVVIPQHIHLRARSEPSTPKNVHFPESLATVRVFSRSARPAALSNPAIGDETETEGEDTPPSSFPFPTVSPVFNYEIDPTNSSSVPCCSCPCENVLLESLRLPQASHTKPSLTGSVLVRNLAFEKHVAVRFTLDDWQTVSEVGAHYLDSFSSLPSRPSSSSPSTSEDSQRGWDRFTFTIRLEDYAHSLSARTLWLAARYRVHSTYPTPGSSQHGPGGEWWDNNGGGNYRLAFRAAMAPTRSSPRRETVSAPVSSLPTRTHSGPPTACKEHALGLMVPSVPSNRRLTPLHAGKLTLCNYAPPTTRPTSSITPSSSDDDSTSPSSSTLSTPSVSPTIVPRVIIGGQPATPTHASGDKEDDDDDGAAAAITSSRPGHITDWDWTAPIKPRIDERSRRQVDLVPDAQPPERHTPSPPGRRANKSLYDTFVTQWCFAQGPSSRHHAYDAGGIMT